MTIPKPTVNHVSYVLSSRRPEGGHLREETKKKKKGKKKVWLSLRQDKEPGAIFQEKVFNISINMFSRCSESLKSHQSWLAERKKPILSSGSISQCFLIPLSSLSRLQRQKRSSCWRRWKRAHSLSIHKLSAATFREGEKHNKFKLWVRVPEGNNVEGEQGRPNGRSVCACLKRGVD